MRICACDGGGGCCGGGGDRASRGAQTSKYQLYLIRAPRFVIEGAVREKAMKMWLQSGAPPRACCRSCG